MVKEKNLPLLIRVLKKICENHSNVYLLIAGDGPEKSALVSQMEKLELSKKVRFMGFVKDTRVLYANADIVVQTSDTEAMPNSILEAMAMSKPVIATAVGGVPELICSGRDGILCGAGKEDEFYQALVELILNPGRREQMGKAAREKMINQFSFEKRVKKLEVIYQELI